MNFEIERKFLVQRVPEGIRRCRHTCIQQGYVAVEGSRAEVRLRRQDERMLLGMKSGGGIVRQETEVLLSKDQFDALWPCTAGRRLEKTRYFMPFNGLEIEVDVYRGALSGLVVAEVEFGSEQAARSFAGPSWFGREISGDPAYKNARLCENGLPEDHEPVLMAAD